jgi:hypothetical protein
MDALDFRSSLVVRSGNAVPQPNVNRFYPGYLIRTARRIYSIHHNFGVSAEISGELLHPQVRRVARSAIAEPPQKAPGVRRNSLV